MNTCYALAACTEAAIKQADALKMRPESYDYHGLTDPANAGRWLYVVTDEDGTILHTSFVTLLSYVESETRPLHIYC